MEWKLLNSSSKAGPEVSSDEALPHGANDGFHPLTLPLMVGPGSISVALTIGAHRAGKSFKDDIALVCGSALLGLLALTITIYGAYRFGSSLVGWLGDTGVNVVVRLSAFILICIGDAK